MAFALNLPKLSYSGVGAIDDAIATLSQQPVKRALVVTDKNLVELGLLDHLFDLLDQASIDYELFDRSRQTRRRP